MKVMLKVLCLCVLLEICSSDDLFVNNTTAEEVFRNDTAPGERNGDSTARRNAANTGNSNSGARDDQLMVLLANRRRALMNNKYRPIDEVTTSIPRSASVIVPAKNPKFNSSRSYARPEIRLTARNSTEANSKRREFRPGGSVRPTRTSDVKENEPARIRNDTEDIFEVDESNQGLFVVNPKTLEYVPPNDSVPPNSNEVYGSDSRSRLSNIKDQSEEQDYDLASFQYFGQKISTPRSNETRSSLYRHNSPPVVRWRTNGTKSSREDESSDMMDIGVARTSVEQNKIRHLKMTAQNRRLALYNNLYRKSGASRLVPGKGNFTLANDTQITDSRNDSSRKESLVTDLPMIEINETKSQRIVDVSTLKNNDTENIISTTNLPITPSAKIGKSSDIETTKRSIINQNITDIENVLKALLPDVQSNTTFVADEEITEGVTTEASTEFLIIIPSVLSEDESESIPLDFNIDSENNNTQKQEVTLPTLDSTPEESLQIPTARTTPKMNITRTVTTRPKLDRTSVLPDSIRIENNTRTVNKTAMNIPITPKDPKLNITVVYRTTSSSNNNTLVINAKISTTTEASNVNILTSAATQASTPNILTIPTISSTIASRQKINNITTTTKYTTTKSSITTKFKTTTSAPTTSSTTSLPSTSSVILNTPENSTSTNDTNNKNEYITSIKSNKTHNLPDVNITEPSAVKTTSGYDSILRTNNDVIMEIHRINMATYVLAGLGLVPVILITVYVVVNLLNKAKKIPEDMEHCAKDSTPIANTAVDDDCDLYSVTSEYHFDRANLRFKSILGEGNFGQVWKAEADDLSGHFGSTRIVAVKAERDEGGPGLRAEAEIMKKLGQHINVVTLLGLCMEQEPHLLIMEFAMRGRLLSLLRACKGPEGIREERDRTPPIANRQLTGFALDVAKGMEYIAARKIVHRDLAARNVLIDHNGVCKICDFGMSLDLGTARVISLPNGADSTRRGHLARKRRPLRRLRLPESRAGATRSRPAMPIRWMAPESLQMHLYSTETDVWAFGVLLWEIFTLGCTPYPNLSGREVVRLVPSGLRLDNPRRCCSTVLNLMARCWKSDSAQRPTFPEARHDLAALHRAESAAVDAMDDASTTDCFDVSGFSEDYENGVVYFDRRISEFECDI